MNKKKLVSLCLVLALLVTAAVGATFAYFTDTDAQKNTFTTGKVEIEQLERQYNDNGGLDPFVQDQTMVPAVGTEVCDDKNVDGHETHFIDTEKMKNVKDKIVNVHNKSTVDIYAATLIAVEDTNDVSTNFKFQVGDTTNEKGYWIPLRYNGALSGNNIQIKDEEGTVYTVNIKIYDEKIAPEGYSPCALTQVYMKPTATEDSVKDAGDTYDIACLSLGVQADGFDSAQAAIEAGFNFDVEKIDATMAKAIAAMFGENYVAGYYVDGGFTEIE